LRGETRVAAQLVARLLGHSRVNIISSYCGTVVNMSEVHKNRAVAELDALQPHIEAMTAALGQHGFISLYMVGTRAMGRRRPQDTTVPYEFVTFGDMGQPTPQLQADLEAILKTRVHVRVMADTPLEISATYLDNMLVVIDGGVGDSSMEDGESALDVA